jgi:hypothetical protein
MSDPFKLFGWLLMALFKVFACTLVFLAQIVWFLLHQRSDRIGEAMGWYGKGLIDCTTDVFRS